eukprot:TRINITY_DN22221_c0_g1_i1.p1 TRINITY_DN22221_c0_g1~~TRINITY_DN22221_c0_g1_i1.p1  ORF type:complete len:249 (+),score=138.45 TRINITY_DN22221_c0_g1_i1:54-800(+)
MYLRSGPAQRRALHHFVFVEDHKIVTGNRHRVHNLTEAFKAMESTLKKDGVTLVKLNSGYFRPNNTTYYAKGEFDAAAAADLNGNEGPSGQWSNINRKLKKEVLEGNHKEIRMVLVTNGGDKASPYPFNNRRGSEELVKAIAANNPSLKYTTWFIGLDVTRPQERSSFETASSWTGGRALLLDCDGKDDDGTSLGSKEATEYFAAFNETNAAKNKANIADQKKKFDAANGRRDKEILGGLPPHAAASA